MDERTDSAPASTTPRAVGVNGQAPDAKSYGQILKSSTIIGGSAVVNVLMGVVRAKVNAVLLGPTGVGLIGIYSSIAQMVVALAGMGVSSSGVRQIAEAAGTCDQTRIAYTTLTLRRVAWVLGLAGALVLFLFRKPICRMTFGDTEHVRAVGWLAVLIFFGNVAGGQAALVQGLRRIGDLARRSVIGSVLGTAASVVLIYFYRERGIVASLVAVATLELVISWWYARKVRVEQATLKWDDFLKEGQRLLTLGLVLTVSGLIVNGSAYVTRLFIVRQFGVDDVGLYQAASTLSIVYAGFILQAMGTDFYPRLTAVAKDHSACNRLVNEQAEVGLLLAVPGILATLTFTPLVIHAFYSAKFVPAVDILRWQILGILLRVGSWPMAFIMLAKELKKAFLWTEVVFGGINVGLTYLFLRLWGLPGAGIAFFAMYALYWWTIFLLVRKVTGFSWSRANVRLATVLVPSVIMVFASSLWLPEVPAIIIGSVVTLVVTVYNFRFLRSAVGSEGFEFLSSGVRRLLGRS